MARTISLKRFAVQNVNYDYLGAYRLRVEATDAVGMDSRVFVYQREPTNPYINDTIDQFLAVASPVDMADWPPGEPNPALPFMFFRNSFVELDFRTVGEAMSVWHEIIRQVCLLVEALNKLDELTFEESVTCGVPDTGGSISAPTSDSSSVSVSGSTSFSESASSSGSV